MKEIFDNKEKNILFINDLKRVRFNSNSITRPAASGSIIANLFSPQETAGIVSGSNFPVIGTSPVQRNAPLRRTQAQDREHAITDTLVTTVRSFEELHQITKGQGYEGVMTPEVFRALSQGKEVQIKINQRAPERVNMLTPMVTAVMALLGGLGGAAYNEKLMNTIGNDIRKAAEFVRKFGTNYDFGLGTGSHIDREVEFSVKDDDNENKKEKNPEMNFDWRNWNYINEERPRGNNLTVANNFDRRSEYTKVEYPLKEEPYIPPYLDKSINTDNQTVNNAVKMSQLLYKLNKGEELSTDDQDALKKYAGVENISDLKNLDKMKEVLTKIKTDIGTIQEGPNKEDLTRLIENIDEFNSMSESSHRISNLESKLNPFGDKSILSEGAEKALEKDLNNMYKALINDLKAAGIDVSTLSKNGNVDLLSELSKLIAENKQIPEPLKANIQKVLELSDKANSIIKRTEEYNAIPEYNESIAEDENFTPKLRNDLLNSGLDISFLKAPQGDLDPIKVFKFAALMDDLKTGKVKIENVQPPELKELVRSLDSKPQIKSDLEQLGMNVNAYDKARTNEQEFVEILKKYPGIMGEGYAYDKLGAKDKLTGSVASGLDVYGIFSNEQLKKSVQALHKKGNINKDDNDFQKVLNSVNGKVLVANGEVTKSGEMTIHFLKLAAKAGIISQSELDSAEKSKPPDGKKLAQLFLETELKLHNDYGLKIDGQLGAEHMTDITHALRNNAQQYTTMANLFMDFYSTNQDKQFDDSDSQLDGNQDGLTNKQVLIDLISQNKSAFIGKEFGGIKFDENTDVEKFLSQILTNKKGATEFLSTIKNELEGIQKEIKGNTFIKDYGQAKELIDDIDFVIKGTKQRDGRILAENPNSGIDAMIKYVDKTDGVGTQQGKEITGEQYLEQISRAIDSISQVPKNTPIKLGEHSFKNKDEALKFLYKEYQKVLLSGIPIRNEALSPEKMADKFVNAFKDTSAGYDDIRETISLLGEANNRSFDFKSHNITVNNTTPEVMKKQVNSLPEDTLPELKNIKNLMNEMIDNPETSKNKVDELLEKMKESFQNVPNNTKGEELAKMYLAMAEKLIKKAEGKGPTDPPDLTELFAKARVPQKDGSIMGVKEAFELAIKKGQELIKTTAK